MTGFGEFKGKACWSFNLGIVCDLENIEKYEIRFFDPLTEEPDFSLACSH